MADDSNETKKDAATAGDTQPVKRPYATLDLKATEIKVTTIADKAQSYTASQSHSESTARGSIAPVSDNAASTGSTPRPAPATAYATADAIKADTSPKSDVKAQSPASQTFAKPAAAASSASTASAAAPEKIVIKKRGGFFSHMAASIIGGVLALSASEWALPQLGIQGTTSRLADNTSAIDQRLQALEKVSPSGAAGTALADSEERLAALEKSMLTIPSLSESQSRLVAETKSALAAAASDAGEPEQLERLGKIEAQMKALAEAGANDPSSGRLAQLAALTGKVADLETSLSTQLTALRKSVAEDVEGRITAATEASESAKSGTQRIDRDVASVKTESIRLTERLQVMKTDSDRLTETLKMAQEETSALKAALDSLKSNVAKPADIATAVAPFTQKLAELEQNVQSVVKAEADRRSNAERIVLSLELQNLKRALDRGQKFGNELDEVQKASGGKLDLAALAKFKDQGVPALADLTRDFRSTANAAIDADTEPVQGGVVDRLLASAKSVVRVRKINHTPGDKSAEAIAGRMDVAMKEGRLADVLEEGKGFSQKAQDAARPFLDKVAARVSVDTAVASLETQLKSSLSAAPAVTPKTAP